VGEVGDSLGTGRGAGPSPWAPIGASQDQGSLDWILILILPLHKKGIFLPNEKNIPGLLIALLAS